MYLRDYRDIAAGGLLTALGAFFVVYTILNYRLGTVTQIGPGMFPLWLGGLLSLIGIAVTASAFFRSGPRIEPHYRQFIAVIAGLLAFALTVDGLGMVPAIFFLVIAASSGDGRLGVLQVAALAAALSAISVLTFHFGLGVPIAPIRWPF
jgi:hypothetical protein